MTADTHPEFFTQLNLAAVLANDEFRGRYRWAKGLAWLAWDGRRWAECPEEAVVEVARIWALRNVSKAVGDHRTGRAPDSAAVGRWLKTAQAAGSLRAIVGLAKGVAGIITPASAFDRYPDLLNTPTGVVDLRTGTLSKHDPELLLTKITRADYVPRKVHPDWLAALEAIPQDCRAYVQLRYGQAITGHMTPDDKLLVQQGSGENGKTTVMGAIAAALGEYYTHVSDRVILGNPNDHPTEMMELRGARLAGVEETPETRQLSVARLKKLIGTPKITARLIRRDSVTFDASHTLVVSTNYTPLVQETDHGTWRRLMLLRYPYRFRKEQEKLEHSTDRRGDPGLRDRVCRDDAASAAVLKWLVDGAVAWYAFDRVMPPEPVRIKTDTDLWRREADLVLAYIDERMVLDPAGHVMATELLADFNEWLRSHGHREWGDKMLVSRFTGHDALSGNVEKQKIRHRPGLSRPTATWSMTALPAPAVYAAWLGLRFAEVEEPPLASRRPQNLELVPAVPGSTLNAIEGLS
ncbi:DNA primase family protein [Jatrophihabitans sp. DSM 45814]